MCLVFPKKSLEVLSFQVLPSPSSLTPPRAAVAAPAQQQLASADVIAVKQQYYRLFE